MNLYLLAIAALLGVVYLIYLATRARTAGKSAKEVLADVLGP